MLTTNKILAVVLIAALAGGTVGVILMQARDTASAAAPTNISDTSNPTDRTASVANVSDPASAANLRAAGFGTTEEQTAYKMGFADGLLQTNKGVTSRANVVTSRASYNHAQPQQRSFWNKHRDKLTVAMGSGGGALLGALIGGKKGAGIGALAGAGGSALYTYKLRNRSHR